MILCLKIYNFSNIIHQCFVIIYLLYILLLIYINYIICFYYRRTLIFTTIINKFLFMFSSYYFAVYGNHYFLYS